MGHQTGIPGYRPWPYLAGNFFTGAEGNVGCAYIGKSGQILEGTGGSNKEF